MKPMYQFMLTMPQEILAIIKEMEKSKDNVRNYY